jgi:hypothetical protein
VRWPSEISYSTCKYRRCEAGAVGQSGWRGIGVLPTDSRDEALRKETLVLSASVITAIAVIWVGTYWALGLYLSAAIPFAYQLISLTNLALFAKTKRYRFFRACELALSLVLPFILQLSLGGFVPSSGVILWSFTAPSAHFSSLGERMRPAGSRPFSPSSCSRLRSTHSWRTRLPRSRARS